MQQYVIFNILKKYCISKEEEETNSSTIAVRGRWRNGCDTFPVVSQWIDKFGGSHEGKVTRHPVTSLEIILMECASLITHLQIASCLKSYPATVCSADELPSHVVEVTGWRVTFPSCDPPNLSIHWETTENVSQPFRQRPRTAIVLLFVSSSSLQLI
jgi:hypothetical protein